MRIFAGVILYKWIVLFTLLFVSSVLPPCFAHQRSANFHKISVQIACKFSSTKDLSSLHCISHDGLILTARGVAPSEIHDMKIPSLLDPNAKLEPHRIIEDTVEVGPLEFNQPLYKMAIDQARHLVADSFAGPRDWITVSNLAYDKWSERLLGPAITGKVAAGTYWYLYLRKEHGLWKIWKFEIDE